MNAPLTNEHAECARPAYREFAGLVSPEELGVSLSGVARAVEAPREMLVPALRALPTPLDHERLVLVEGPCVQNIAAYWHAGWSSATLDAYLREGVMARLVAAAGNLDAGFGLAVLDGWRSTELQQELYDAAYGGGDGQSLPDGFVAEPTSDSLSPAPHLTGGAVDVTLSWNGVPLALGTQFDDFSPAAAPAAFEGSESLVRDLRRLLWGAMRSQGFVQDPLEWWHYEYGTRRWAAVTGSAPLYGPATPPGA